MLGPYFHDIDPVLFGVGGVYLWWYGLGFAFGFLEIHLFLRRGHEALGISLRQAWALSLVTVIGALAGGRAIEIAFDEWPFYRCHLELIPAYWLGGMATHGVMLGVGLATLLFSRLHRISFLLLADALVIPGAFLMGVGRIGNFIDGQIVGSATDVCWAVKFPDAEGLRHPVVLYDGAKNLLLMLFLMRVRRNNPTPGAVAARFVFWYAFPRIFIDLFRDYPTHRLALGTGQTLNILMAAAGVVLLIRSRMRRLGRLATGPSATTAPTAPSDQAPTAFQRVAFASLLAFCLLIPSNWTQNIPARYGSRHPGMENSWIYPAIDTSPRNTHFPTDRSGNSFASDLWISTPFRVFLLSVCSPSQTRSAISQYFGFPQELIAHCRICDIIGTRILCQTKIHTVSKESSKRLPAKHHPSKSRPAMRRSLFRQTAWDIAN